jgi:hypothetical protein
MRTVQVQEPIDPQAPKSALRHDRPLQHEPPPAEQVCPGPTQVAAWQVPKAEPVLRAQLVPLQQSADDVQVPPWP